MNMTVGILAALFARQSSGKGQRIDVSVRRADTCSGFRVHILSDDRKVGNAVMLGTPYFQWHMEFLKQPMVT